jgi:hypothetical protein
MMKSVLAALSLSACAITLSCSAAAQVAAMVAVGIVLLAFSEVCGLLIKSPKSLRNLARGCYVAIERCGFPPPRLTTLGY